MDSWREDFEVSTSHVDSLSIKIVQHMKKRCPWSVLHPATLELLTILFQKASFSALMRVLSKNPALSKTCFTTSHTFELFDILPILIPMKWKEIMYYLQYCKISSLSIILSVDSLKDLQATQIFTKKEIVRKKRAKFLNSTTLSGSVKNFFQSVFL